MKKLAKYGAGLLALVCAFGLGRGDTTYTETDLARAREEAYNNGYHTGYDEGLAAHQQAIYEEAFAAGQSEGYNNGYASGFSEGSSQIMKEAQAAQPQYVTAQPPSFPSAATAEFPSPVPTETSDSQQVTVYVTESGSKYHLEGCRHLKSKIQKTLAEAKALQLEPCKVCNPPK